MRHSGSSSVPKFSYETITPLGPMRFLLQIPLRSKKHSNGTLTISSSELLDGSFYTRLVISRSIMKKPQPSV